MLDAVSKKMIFLVGPGGVGKTTMSAALGFLLRRFEKTIVITIDPAKRLKSALSITIEGIKKIDENIFVTQVDKEKEFRKFAFENNIGEITKTKLFEIASDLLPSEEYSAALKILDIYENYDFKFIVVDTPPSTKLLAFLDAPEKLLSMFETNSVKYFLEIVATAGKRISMPLSIAGRLFGLNFIVEFGKFLSSLKTVFGKMENLSRIGWELISKSIIVGVTSPYDRKIDELVFMLDEIKRRKLEISGIIVNRFLDFAEDRINPNWPSNIVELHKKLVTVSNRMRKNIEELKRFDVPILIIREKFMDINSRRFVELISDELEEFILTIMKNKAKRKIHLQMRSE